MEKHGQEAKEGAKGATRPRSLLGFLPDQGNRLGSANLNNFGGLWAMGVVPSCLVCSPGNIKAEAYCFLGYKVKEEVASRLVSLHIKSMLLLGPCYLQVCPSFQRGSLSPTRKIFQDVKHHNTKKM